MKAPLVLSSALLAAITLLAHPTFAGTVTVTSPIGIADPTEAQPIPTTAQAFIGAGSWQAPGAGGKTDMYFTPASLGFSSDITINNISSMSWAVNSPHNVDWYLTIYTKPTGSGDDASWYHHRLTFEGLYANNFNAPANTWITLSSDAGTNQITAYDGNRGGAQGFYGGPTLQNLQSDATDWASYANSGITSSTIYDYADSPIEYFALSTGSAWANSYTGYVDDFSVALTSGSSTTVDFESVPLPASIWGGALLLGLMAGWRLLHRKRLASAAA